MGPAQNVVVDAPHLYERYWQLLGADPADVEAWNSTVSIDWESFPEALEPAIERRMSPFLARPVFHDAALRPIVVAAYSRGLAQGPFDLAFAEDVSGFFPVGEMSPFQSDLDGPFQRRRVKEIDGVGYEPSNRLLV